MNGTREDLELALRRALEDAVRRVGPAVLLRIVELAVEDLAGELDATGLAHRAVSGAGPAPERR